MLLERIAVGDTLNFATSAIGYAASDGWTLKYTLVPRTGGGAAISITSAADSDDAALHRVQVPAATTATWAAGAYSWQSWVEKATEKYTVATGTIELVADARGVATGPLDLRTAARVALDNVRALLHGKASSGTLSYQINGRELRSYAMAELLQLESKLQGDVRREEAAARTAAGLPSRRQLHVRLHRA